MRDDRCVHARYEGMEIVRYGRTGKWFLEPMDLRLHRQHVKSQEAARSAFWGKTYANGEIIFGLPGGEKFDLAVISFE